jgi:hypothetical protein
MIVIKAEILVFVIFIADKKKRETNQEKEIRVSLNI